MSKLMEALFPQGQPSLVACGAEGEVAACLAALANDPRSAELLAVQASTEDGFWPAPGHWMNAYRPYVVAGGILQIPVKGVLLADLSFTFGGYATGYAYIARALARGLADPEVRGIALLMNTPGGEVRGCFDLADKVALGAKLKPILAVAYDHAYSAGYALGCAASRVVVSRTGGVGSIGVVTSHVDASAALAQAGLRITFIHAGAHKVDGNSANPLSAEAKARIQARIDELMSVFVGHVARCRNLSEDAVRATEALTFTASQAIESGLADAIGSADDAVAAFAADLSTDPEDETMITPEAHAAAVDAARTEGEAAGKTEGMNAAHERMSAILASDKLKPGAALAAVELAIVSPSMTAEAVIGFAAKHAPAAPAAAAPSRLDTLVPDPNVSADGGAEKPEATGLSAAVSADLAVARR